MRNVLRSLIAALAAALLVGSKAQPTAPEVLPFKLSMSNVYAIKGARIVLVDAGSKGDLPKLESEMGRAGITWKDVAAVIVTHGHSDHAALAAEIRRRSSASVILGSGDVGMAGAGHNDELKPTNFLANLLKQFAVDPTYEAFKPDRVVEREMRLDEWGITGRRHDPGRLSGRRLDAAARRRALLPCRSTAQPREHPDPAERLGQAFLPWAWRTGHARISRCRVWRRGTRGSLFGTVDRPRSNHMNHPVIA